MPIALAVIVPIIAISLVGDYYIKLAAEGRGFSSRQFWLGAGLYAVTAVGLMVAMRHMSLAAVGVWYAILTVLAMSALGVVVFGEKLALREIAGIGFACAALVCMARFA